LIGIKYVVKCKEIIEVTEEFLFYLITYKIYQYNQISDNKTVACLGIFN